MAYLVDTNVLLRSKGPNHTHHQQAVDATATLFARGETLYIARQNLIEFRNVATRPVAKNGLGFSHQDADRLLARLEMDFSILRDTDDIYFVWRQLVSGLGVMGKQVHDARLVAAMLVYNVTHLLTFNVQDFVRFQTLPPGLGVSITVVHPGSV